MEEDTIIRFIVSTDNHLGFCEKDPVRCNDSFATFEEVLKIAKQKNVDFVLFAGDMFHENKPTRHTLHSTMELLRTYCMGSNPVFIEILNDQEEIFRASMGKVNYEDPYQSISLPIFAIHGNHDDPSREGTTGDALAALDLLAVTNLINYFGKSDRVEDIEIAPILIRKGTTKIALYGLGAIRDERLNRMWNQKKVKFIRLTQEQGRDEFFNIFLLHQNRDYGRGKKNCVHESMIPDWMDLVIWGNEHECQPQLMESLVGTYRILQPGSSVACSLSKGESTSCPKHMAYFEVKERKFRMKPIKYKSIRPFVYDELILKDFPDLNSNDPKIEDKIREKLNVKVNSMIREARAEIIQEDQDEMTHFKVLNPEKVLVRLRVEYDGFPAINHQRFGSQYVNAVANPSEILLLAKKRKETVRVDGDHAPTAGDYKQIFAEGVEEEINKIMIEDLVNNVLATGKNSLSVLLENEMAKALDDFIFRKDTDAIKDVVSNSLQRIQIQLARDNVANQPVAEGVARVRQALQTDDALREAKLVAPRNQVAMEVEDDFPEPVVSEKKAASKSGSKKAVKETASTKSKSSASAAPTSRKSSRTMKSTKSYVESDDSMEADDANFEEEDGSIVEDSDELPEDESEEEYVKPKKATKAATKAKAPPKVTTKATTNNKTAVSSRGRKKDVDPILEDGDVDVFQSSAKASGSSSISFRGKSKTVVNLADDDDIEESPQMTSSTALSANLVLPSSSQNNTQDSKKSKQRQLPLSFTQTSAKPKSTKTGNLASGWDD